MALEVLSGPVPITVDGVNAGWGFQWQNVFIQGIGLISLTVTPAEGHGIAGTYAAQWDGSAFFRSPFAWGSPSLILIPDLRTARGIAMYDGNYSDFDAIAGAPYPVPWLVTAGGVRAATCVLQDRFLLIDWEKVLASALTDSVTYIEEYSFSDSPPTGSATISRTNIDGVICIA